MMAMALELQTPYDRIPIFPKKSQIVLRSTIDLKKSKVIILWPIIALALPRNCDVLPGRNLWELTKAHNCLLCNHWPGGNGERGPLGSIAVSPALT